MKKKKVHRLAAFMTACFLAAGDLGNSGYVMVSGEAVASETVSLQEEQAEGQAESTPVAGSGGTEEISGTEIPQITPAQGNAAENAPAAPTGQEEKQEQPASQEQEADQEQAADQKQSAEQEQNKDQTAASDEATQENEEQAAPEGQDQSSETAASGIKKQIQDQGFAYVETKEDHVTIYTAADGSRQKKGEILKKDSLLLGEQYVENQDGQDWVKVWFDTDTEEGKMSGFVTSECLKKDPVENQAALQRIQTSGQAVDAWQDPGMTRPLAEVAYQSVEAAEPDKAAEGSSAKEKVTEENPAEETDSTETAVEETAAADTLVDESGTAPDEKEAEGEAQANRKDITFRIHWDESAMPEMGEGFRPNSISVSLYQENVYKKSASIYKRDYAGQDSWEAVFKSMPICDPTGNEYVYSVKYSLFDSSHIYKCSPIRQSGKHSEVYEMDAVLQKTTMLRAEIRWDDYENINELRPKTLTPEMVTINNVKQESETYQAVSVEKQENGNFIATFENIPTLDTKSGKAW